MKLKYIYILLILIFLIGNVAALPPSAPTNLNHDSNDINYINWSWDAGTGGNDTDSYNITNNNIWYNGTTDTYFNITGAGQLSISSISVYAYNSTYAELSAPVNGYYQIPLNTDKLETEIQALWGGFLLSGIMILVWFKRKLAQDDDIGEQK